MSKRKNRKRKKKIIERSPFQRGLKIACINTHGLVSNPTKRIDLNNWATLHNLDVICIQEWYVPKKKDVKENNKNNGKNKNDDDDDDDDDENNEINELAPLNVTLDMTAFANYDKVEHDNKTLIIFKSTLDVIRFDHFPKITNNGLDISWIAIKTNRKIIVIGSIYHSPSFECDYDQISNQIRRIKSELKEYGRYIIFSINGDYNSKHEIWGSTITDARGEHVLDWIGENHITYMNNGDWTYKTNKGKRFDDNRHGSSKCC